MIRSLSLASPAGGAAGSLRSRRARSCEPRWLGVVPHSCHTPRDPGALCRKERRVPGHRRPTPSDPNALVRRLSCIGGAHRLQRVPRTRDHGAGRAPGQRSCGGADCPTSTPFWRRHHRSAPERRSHDQSRATHQAGGALGAQHSSSRSPLRHQRSLHGSLGRHPHRRCRRGRSRSLHRRGLDHVLRAAQGKGLKVPSSNLGAPTECSRDWPESRGATLGPNPHERPLIHDCRGGFRSAVDNDDLPRVGGWRKTGVELCVDHRQPTAKASRRGWRLEQVAGDDLLNHPGGEVRT